MERDVIRERRCRRPAQERRGPFEEVLREQLKGRLGRLERTINVTCASDLAQIQAIALRAISDENLGLLESFATRGATFENCSAAEKAALERYEVEIEAAKGLLRRRRLGWVGRPETYR